MKILRYLVLASSSILLPMAAVAQSPQAGAAPDAPAPVMAVWVEKNISFTFVGITSHYSCDGLRDKVSRILKEIGVRPGFKVSSGACVHTTGPERMPIARIVAALPRPATPEVLAELRKTAAQSELAGKAGGRAAPVEETTAEFPARMRRIEFRDSPTGLVQMGDCELIEQMRDSVFVPLGATVAVDRMSCQPHAVSPGDIDLTIEVLEPVPQK
jgi:hypothetical protein